MTPKIELTKALSSLLLRLGAVRAEVQPDGGVASWWRTEREADKAKEKFQAMGLLNVERWQEKSGAWAVFARSPVTRQFFSVN